MKYIVLHFSFIPSSHVGLVSECFRIWSEVYHPILNQSGERLTVDYFYRCRMLSVLVDETSKVIAFCLINNMQTEIPHILEHSYFEPAPREYLERLKAEREHVMTIEWVTVNPTERGKFTKIQPVDLIMGLTFKLAQFSAYTAVMGYSRIDLKADKVAAKFGPRPMGDTNRHDVHCKVMYCKTRDLNGHPISKVQTLIEDLWRYRDHDSPFTETREVFERKVA